MGRGYTSARDTDYFLSSTNKAMIINRLLLVIISSWFAKDTSPVFFSFYTLADKRTFLSTKKLFLKRAS